MATFKHISSKNADYGAAEQYLTFEHDDFTMKPTLEGNGRLVLRDDYRISSLNCGEEDFAIACMRSNLKYGKNQKREDVKSHHYIISFDPRDAPDNGLTVERAQQLGEQFCKAHFPGHQALVCTHPDGHNYSGNIHVHIVINSLRIAEMPLLPYMERPADTKEGCKHRCTDAAMEYFKAEVMEMCYRENLYQIDLFSGGYNTLYDSATSWIEPTKRALMDEIDRLEENSPKKIRDIMGWSEKLPDVEVWRRVLKEIFLDVMQSDSGILYVEVSYIKPRFDRNHSWYKCEKCSEITPYLLKGGFTDKKMQIRNSTADFLVFTKENREDSIEVRVHDEDVWLTQKSMAQLFECSTDNIGLHLKNIFASGELDAEAVTEKSSVTASDGKKYRMKFYNLDAIISVGYRINSIRATQFRQ